MFRCTELIDFGIRSDEIFTLEDSVLQRQKSKIFEIRNVKGSGMMPLTLKKIEVYTQRATPVNAIGINVLKKAKKNGTSYQISGQQSGL